MKVYYTLLLIFFSLLTYAQDASDVNIYLYNKKWDPPYSLNKAAFLCERTKVNDTTYIQKYYKFKGPLTTIETTKDEEGKQLNGFVAIYDNGAVESCGSRVNGLKHGFWYYYTDTLAIWKRETYDNGKLLEQVDSVQLRMERDNEYDAVGPKEALVEASFKGGDTDWKSYLQQYLETPERTDKFNVTGELLVSFVVNTNGGLESIFIERSLDYATDLRVIEALKRSPKWTPASINGKPVRAFRKQPITIAKKR